MESVQAAASGTSGRPGWVSTYLYVHVQPVVEVSQPEEVREAQRDVEGAQLLVSQREQAEDVQVVLVPPGGVRGHG